jgi:hypothetical protein
MAVFTPSQAALPARSGAEGGPNPPADARNARPLAAQPPNTSAVAGQGDNLDLAGLLSSPGDLLLTGTDLPSGIDLVSSLLTGGRALPNLLPRKGSSLAPVATVLIDDAGEYRPSPADRPDEEPVPGIDFVVGLDDTIDRPRPVPPAPRPSSRLNLGSPGGRSAVPDGALLAPRPPLLQLTDQLGGRLVAGSKDEEAPDGLCPPPESVVVLTGLLAALALSALDQTSFDDPGTGD